MKKVYISLPYQLEVEEHNMIEGAKRVLELVSEDFPVRASVMDPKTGDLFITFGCKGAILTEEE